MSNVSVWNNSNKSIVSVLSQVALIFMVSFKSVQSVVDKRVRIGEARKLFLLQ